MARFDLLTSLILIMAAFLYIRYNYTELNVAKIDDSKFVIHCQA